MSNEELITLYQQGNTKVLNNLIENNRGLINKIANKFYVNQTNSIDIEDLIQEGNIGLIIAVNKYDSNKAKFLTYATYWIYQKINYFIKNNNTNGETSLNVHVSENNDSETERQEVIESVECGFENVEEKLYIMKLREDLEEVMEKHTTLRERQILKLRYGWDCKECTFTYIASIFNITSSRVQQIENKALRSIRRSKWARIEYKKYYATIRHNYNTVENKIDFINKYFNGTIEA